MPAPLTNVQKAYLARLSRDALVAAGERQSEIPDCGCGLGDAVAFRHNAAVTACGKHGLRCCTQDDYGVMKGHLLALLGQEGRALNAMVHSASNPKRVAMWKLRQACSEAGVGIGYAAAICRDQNRGMGLEEISDKAVWRLVFTVKNRGKSRRVKEAA